MAEFKWILHSCYCCGGVPELIHSTTNLWEVICPDCGLNIRRETEDEAAKAWNNGHKYSHRLSPVDAFDKVREYCDEHEGCENCPAALVGCSDGCIPYLWSRFEEEDYDS